MINYPITLVTKHNTGQPFFVLVIDLVEQSTWSNSTKLSYQLVIRPNGCKAVWLKSFLAQSYYMDKFQTDIYQNTNIAWTYQPNNHVDDLSKNNKVTADKTLRRGDITFKHDGYGECESIHISLGGTISYDDKNGAYHDDTSFSAPEWVGALDPIDIGAEVELVTNGKDFGKKYTLKPKVVHSGGNSGGVSGSSEPSEYNYIMSYSYESDPQNTERTKVYGNVNDVFNYTFPLDDMKNYPTVNDVPIKIKIETHYGTSNSRVVGKPKYLTLNVHIPDTVRPNSPTFTYTDISSNTTVKNWDILVEKYSNLKLQVDASAYSNLYGAYPTKVFINGDIKSENNFGSAKTYSINTGILSPGAKKYEAYVIDSRGRKSPVSTINVNVEIYNDPVISKFTARRDLTTGTVVVNGDWDWTSLGNRNKVSVVLFYKKMTGDWIKYPYSINKNADTTLQGTFPVQDAYILQLAIKDSVGITTRYTLKIENSPKMFDMRPRNTGLGIGKQCESDSLEIAFNTIFFGNVELYNSHGDKVTLEQYIREVMSKP